MTTEPTTAVPWAEATAAPTAPPADDPGAPADVDAGVGPSARPRWERPAVIGLLVATAVLYLWDLSASGWANSFYAAAAQAGSKSWTAFLYGASDAAGSITVDKPPASLWVMALSVRVFGLSSWAILVPQALMGVAAVGVLYASVRRQLSAGAALLAGAVLALTPVAALMFRFNNPDALLVLLLVLATAATVRAVEPSTRRRAGWMALAGALVGFAFLTKQLQAFLVLPGLAAAYLWAAPVPLRRRVRDGFIAVGAMVLAGGWWVALVELVPASARPYIGGSQTNSFLELTFGYNGFGRLTGDKTGSVGGGQSGGWGSPGITRMFGSDIGGQIAWLIPAALLLGAVGLRLRRRFARTDVVRAALVAWGAWLVVTMLTFSLMAGIFHAYYTVALAPAIAALVGIGADLVWARRESAWALGLLAGVTLMTGAWSFVLLSRSPAWLPWLRWVVLVGAFGAAATLLAGRWYGRGTLRAGLALALVAGLAGPTAYTLQTVSTGHSGSTVTAGPGVTGTSGGPGGAFRGGQGGGPGGGLPGPGTGTQAGGLGFGGGGIRGLLNGSQASTALTALLLQDADSYTWVAATVGANNAAGYQLASERSVMPLGGFNGSDPSPTLAEFQADVAAGKIHYFISGGGFGRSGGSSASSEITTWVTSTFAAQTVDGATVYDLTRPSS